jgi:hypothetical protein
VNIANNNGATPVTIAAQEGKSEHSLSMKQISVQVYFVFPLFLQPLSRAICTISLLHALGANLAPPPSVGGAITAVTTTVADIARSNGHEEAALLIESMLCELAAEKCHHCGHSHMAKGKRSDNSNNKLTV